MFGNWGDDFGQLADIGRELKLPPTVVTTFTTYLGCFYTGSCHPPPGSEVKKPP